MDIVHELWRYLRIRKKWWLAPMIIIAAIFGSLVVATQGSVIAPFVYTLF